MGVWVDGHFQWMDDGRWERSLRYRAATIVTDVELSHPDLRLKIKATDVVDFHENLLVRRFDLDNLSDRERDVRLFFHQDFHISGNEVGDTAYYEPDRRAVIHYKGLRWFLINGAVEVDSDSPSQVWSPTEDTAPGIVVGLHQWACGLKEIRGLEGTWRDAENGQLSEGNVAHGSVDSTVGLGVRIPARGKRTIWYWMAVGKQFEDVAIQNRMVRQRGPDSFINRTEAFWKLWVNCHKPDLSELPEEAVELYIHSLLIVRTQVDYQGAVIAANDTDISSDVRDTYSYMWPRDGALVANALTRAGYLDLPRTFYQFAANALTDKGYLLHKYNPDGSLASSWHPWVRDGKKDLPIQEDETALVLWALWEHFERFEDVFFIKPLYRSFICKMADFLADFRDPETGLPQPSYDLWEERHGILGWTVGATYGGLIAGAKFARAFGELDLAEKYEGAAAGMKSGVEAILWQPERGCFARMVNRKQDGGWEVDKTIDASLVGLWQFGMFPPDDPKIASTMKAIRERLWVKTEVGGLARYENDHYHQVSQDIENVPGNPWFITTLWLAEWYAVTAQEPADLNRSLELLEWVSSRSLPSNVLAEQVNPYTDEPLSVSPLTWSHAAYIATIQSVLQAAARLKAQSAAAGLTG
jgi:GH15 family glucan-1,4-alpha-glucosidase